MKLVLEWHVCHALHFFFLGNKCPDGCDAESAEKNQQGANTEPLNAVDRLKEVLVHVA